MKLLYPLAGGPHRITQTYQQHIAAAKSHGWCTKPGNCPSGVYYYPGIDYGIPTGTKVIGSKGVAERVQDQGARVGYGKHIRIRHPDNTLTVYGHLSEWYVKTGDQIEDGQIIGLSGNTGYSTGPHLHFEHRDKNGVPVDPTLFLGEAGGDGVPVLIGKLVMVRNDATPFINYRSRPTLVDKEQTDQGDLRPGTTLTVVEISPDGKWVRFGGWASVDYLEVI